MLGRLVLVCAFCVFVASDDTQTGVWTTPQQIVADGFSSETHSVTTLDGYVLEMHRIPYGRQGATSTADRPVVFLMHGLMSHSGIFVTLGAEYSLAYNLADAGFDVWLGNARGNKYSRNHISLDPDDNTQKYTFFDFTFEEIGLHDLPTMMDYILDLTGKQKLHYIGHSQGGTVFLVLGALRPEYNAKIASAHLLAAVGYQEYFPNEELATSAVNVDYIYSIALMMGIVELYPEFLDSLPVIHGYRVADYCTGNLQQKYMCKLFGVRHLLRDDSTTTPGGASLKQAAHYGQNIRDKLFRRYHFGTTSNMEVYGLEEPPLYDVGLITADVTMHYTVNDNLLDERDVLAMAADMPNTKVRKVARENFLHSDFVTALDAKELVTDYIIEELRNTPDADPLQDTTIDTGVNVVDHTTDSPTHSPADSTVATGEQTTYSTTPLPDSATNVMINMYLIFFSLFIIISKLV